MIITVYDDNKAPYEVTLKKDIVSFGRLTDNDIVLNADFVSREHGCFYVSGGSLYVEDRGSTNGIYYRGSRVKQKELVAGDTVEIYKNGQVGRCVRLVVENINANVHTNMQGNNHYGTNMYQNYQSGSMPQTPPQYMPPYAYGNVPVNIPPKADKTSGMAVASMVLGILSILLSCFVPIFPLIMAALAIIFCIVRDKDKAGNGMAIAGLVCSIITCAYYIVAIIYAAAVGSMINSFLNSL